MREKRRTGLADDRASMVGEAQIQSLFRDINERANPLTSSRAEVEVVCECGDASCFQPLTVRRDAYEAVRQVPTRFLLAAGHARRSRDLVVADGEHVCVIEKVGPAAVAARRLDARPRQTSTAREPGPPRPTLAN